MIVAEPCTVVALLTARHHCRLQVQALLAKLEATTGASATAAAAEAQARSRADSRAAAKLKELQVTKHADTVG